LTVEKHPPKFNPAFRISVKGMIEHMDIKVGDSLLMKKPHPCGSKQFEVLRIGMDFRLKCEGCGHEFMSPRLKIERHVKKVISGTQP